MKEINNKIRYDDDKIYLANLINILIIFQTTKKKINKEKIINIKTYRKAYYNNKNNKLKVELNFLFHVINFYVFFF